MVYHILLWWSSAVSEGTLWSTPQKKNNLKIVLCEFKFLFQFTAQQYKSSCWAIVERAGLWKWGLLRLAFGAEASALCKTAKKSAKSGKV